MFIFDSPQRQEQQDNQGKSGCSVSFDFTCNEEKNAADCQTAFRQRKEGPFYFLHHAVSAFKEDYPYIELMICTSIHAKRISFFMFEGMKDWFLLKFAGVTVIFTVILFCFLL